MIPAGYYVGMGNTIYRVTVNKAGTRAYAQKMIVTDGEVEWVYQGGLGVDLLLSPLAVREVSRLVREAVAA